MERCILLVFSFVSFAIFVVQNLPARGRKAEKNKGIILTKTHNGRLTDTFQIQGWVLGYLPFPSIVSARGRGWKYVALNEFKLK
jgi:hypothetical protein